MAPKPCLASMHWLDPHERELAVSREVYERCEIIVMEPSKFDHCERHLEHVAESIRFAGFDDNFPWHRTSVGAIDGRWGTGVHVQDPQGLSRLQVQGRTRLQRRVQPWPCTRFKTCAGASLKRRGFAAKQNLFKYAETRFRTCTRAIIFQYNQDAPHAYLKTFTHTVTGEEEHIIKDGR